MIKVRDWIASIPEEEKHIAYVGEGMSEQREFLLCGEGWEKYKNHSFHLDMEFDATSITTRDTRQVVQTTVNNVKHNEEASVTEDSVTTKETFTVCDEQVLGFDRTDVAALDKWVEEDGIRLTWTVLRQQTALPGKLKATIRAVGEDAKAIKKSAMMVFEVDPSVTATPAAMPAISEFEVMENQMDALRQKAVEAAEEAMRHSVSAASSATGAAQAQWNADKAAQSAAASAESALQAKQTAVEMTNTAVESKQQAAVHSQQAESAATAAIAAYTDAAHYAEEAGTAMTDAKMAMQKCNQYAMRADESATKAANAQAALTDAAEAVGTLEEAVFDVEIVEPSANLYNPATVTEDYAQNDTGKVLYFSDIIPCADGDHLYVRVKDENGNIASPGAGVQYIRVFSDDTTSSTFATAAADYTVSATEGKTVVGVQVGVQIVKIPDGRPESVLVYKNEKPVIGDPFVDYKEGGEVKHSKIERNRQELQEQIGTLTRQTEEWGAAVEAIKESLANDGDLSEGVAAIHAAVFEMVESEPSANLYNPNTAKMVKSEHAAYPDLDLWYCDTIPCVVGDVFSIRLRKADGSLVKPLFLLSEEKGTRDYNAYRLVYADGTKSTPMPERKSTEYVIADSTGKEVVGVDVGIRNDALVYNGVTVFDIMVVKGSAPTTFEEWRASGSVKTSRIEKNEKAIASLQKQVADLQENSGGIVVDGDSQVIIEGTTIGENCAQFAKMLYGTDKAESFIFFTDPHLAMPPTTNFEQKLFAHMNILKTYYEATPTNFLMCGGDWLKDISPYQTDEDACYKLGYVSSWMRANFDRYYTAIGNHEDNAPYGIDGVGGGKGANVGLSKETIRNLMLPYEKELYYSFDGAQTKCYVLNSSDPDQEGDTYDTAYRWEQVAWLGERLKEDDAENAALFIHAGFTRSSNAENGRVLSNISKNILQLCQAYNNGTTITLNGVSYDFTGCTGCVRFMMAGHIHDADCVETHYGIPVILTYNMTKSADSGNGTDALFDLCLADYDTGLLRMMRIGKYGADREVVMASRGT